MTIVYFTVVIVHCSLTTRKSRDLVFLEAIAIFQMPTLLSHIVTWHFPIAIGKVFIWCNRLLGDITTVIFTVVTGWWTLWCQWQSDFLRWTGSFSCSDLLASTFTFIGWHDGPNVGLQSRSDCPGSLLPPQRILYFLDSAIVCLKMTYLTRKLNWRTFS